MPARVASLITAILIVMSGMTIGTAAFGAANLDEACGGPTHITCNSALWCQRAAGQCKTADAPGTCDKPPAFCIRIFRPVCGCNGKTYPNDCERQKARVQLSHEGACPKEPKAAEPGAEKPKARKK